MTVYLKTICAGKVDKTRDINENIAELKRHQPFWDPNCVDGRFTGLLGVGRRCFLVRTFKCTVRVTTHYITEILGFSPDWRLYAYARRYTFGSSFTNSISWSVHCACISKKTLDLEFVLVLEWLISGCIRGTFISDSGSKFAGFTCTWLLNPAMEISCWSKDKETISKETLIFVLPFSLESKTDTFADKKYTFKLHFSKDHLTWHSLSSTLLNTRYHVLHTGEVSVQPALDSQQDRQHAVHLRQNHGGNLR